MTEIRDAMSPEQFAAVERAGHGRWSQAELLIAGLHDRLAELLHAYSSVHAAKGVKPKRPEPIPRPGVGRKSKAPRPTSVAELLSRMTPAERAEAEAARSARPPRQFASRAAAEAARKAAAEAVAKKP